MNKIDAVIRELEIDAVKRHVPIVGPEKGRFLYILAKGVKAKNALELGTATGYSGIILCKAMGKKGKLATIEFDKFAFSDAQHYFKKAGVSKQVKQVFGDAREAVKKIKGKFDLIFVDIIKSQYIQVLDDCLRLLKKDGLLVADNASFEGAQSYVNAVLKHEKLESVVVPIGDWMAVSVKVKN